MSWGAGFGGGWGGGPLVAIPNPLSQIAGDPTSFDFTDEPDGPIPGSWEFYQLTTTAGAVAGGAEPSPSTYYKVKNGLGLWAYTRSPVSGDPFLEQGVAASPSSTLEGRNSRVAAFFVNPVPLLGPGADEFVFEVIVGVRLEDEGTRFVGGRARAHWTSGGGWAPALAVEAVQALSAAPTVLSSATLPETVKDTDLWTNSSQHEVEVEIREGSLTVTFDGHVQTSAVVPADGPGKALLLARVYNRFGTSIVPQPALIGMQLQSLRDAVRLGPAPQLPGDVGYEAPQLPIRELPASVLLDGALWKRVGARVFEAKTDQEHDVGGNSYVFDEGDLVRATERVQGQFLIPVVPALDRIRGRRG